MRQGVRRSVKSKEIPKISVRLNVNTVLLYPVVRAAVRYLLRAITQADFPSLPHQ
jgi:hypothetical protein